MEVHSRLGPGLLEGVYEESLCHELALSGLAFRRQVESPIRYRDVILATPLRIDLVVEQSLIVEVKAVEAIGSVHEAQLLTYLRLSEIRVGLLINFNVRHLRDGIRRRKL
jgi:GxxExxY protein